MEGNKKERQGLAQAEDLALKSAALYFGEEIIPWLGVKKKVRRIAQEDLIPLLFTPLMGGKSTKKERIQKSIQMLRKTENIFAKAEISKMEAILYVFAAKLLDKTDLESIKEVFSMTLLGQMIWDDALEKGREQESERYSRLILLLNEKKQTDLIVKAASDPEYREMLYRKYHI